MGKSKRTRIERRTKRGEKEKEQASTRESSKTSYAFIEVTI